jgi:hypothetical protein
MLEQQLADTMSGGPKKRRGARWPRVGEHRFFLISLFLSASRQKEKPVRLEDIKTIEIFKSIGIDPIILNAFALC